MTFLCEYPTLGPSEGTVPKTSDQVKISFRLPEDLYDIYAERAAKTGSEPEAEMIKTLSRCRSHNAASPIYMDDSQRNAMSQITGKLVRDGDEIIRWAKQVTTIRVDGTDVQLHSGLIGRLDSRRFGNITRAQLLQQIIPELLEQYVGLR